MENIAKVGSLRSLVPVLTHHAQNAVDQDEYPAVRHAVLTDCSARLTCCTDSGHPCALRFYVYVHSNTNSID